MGTYKDPEYKKKWHERNRIRISLRRIEDYRHKRGSYGQREREFNLLLMGLTEAELGYITGIVEGEGTIHLSRVARNPRFLQTGVSIANTDQSLIEWIQQKLGGLVRWQDGWQRSEGHPVKPVARWIVSGRMAASLCKAMLPHMHTVKKQKAALVVSLHMPPTRVFRIDAAEESRRTKLWDDFKAIK